MSYHIMPYLITMPRHISLCHTTLCHGGTAPRSLFPSLRLQSVGEGRLFAGVICWFACRKDTAWEVAFEKAPQLPGIGVTANLLTVHPKKTLVA